MFPPWAQAWQTLWCSTAQHSSSVMWLISCHVTWMLRILSLNHSLSHALLQPFSTSLYISLILFSPTLSFFPDWNLTTWLPSHIPANRTLEFTLLASFPKLAFKKGTIFHAVFWPTSPSKRFQRNVK